MSAFGIDVVARSVSLRSIIFRLASHSQGYSPLSLLLFFFLLLLLLCFLQTLRQELAVVPETGRDAFVVYLVRSYAAIDVSMILFCATVEDCALLHHMLEVREKRAKKKERKKKKKNRNLIQIKLQALMEGECAVVALHSLMTQASRLRSLAEFRNGRARVLVATGWQKDHYFFRKKNNCF